MDDISFTVMKGETTGVVGESGCGKSTTARLLMQLTHRDSGELIFDGRGRLVTSAAESLPSPRCRWFSR